MGSRLKQPSVNKGKNFEAKNTGINNIDYPIFCFRYLHSDYSLDVIEDTDRICFINKLYQFSKMKWQDIQLAPKHGMGSEKIARNALKPSIPKEITEDVNFFLALRYNGKKPIVGFRNGNIFHIVYIDYNFTVYSH